jgi:uncharacterized protein
MSALDTVQEIYAAFGRGDVPTVLEHLADDVAWEQWEDNHAQRAGVRHLVERNSPAGVGEFFDAVAGLGVRGFEVLDMMAGEDQVAVEVRIETERFTDEELHLWTVGPDGKVTRMRHYVDTAKHIAGTA